MWEATNLDEKKFNAETHKLIGAIQLHNFGQFLESFCGNINAIEEKLTNKCNVTSQLILLDEQVHNNESIFNLVYSDNKNLSHIISCLGVICNEITSLISEANDLYLLFMINDEHDNREKSLKHISISKFIEPLQRVHFFVKRVQTVIILLLKQLCIILDEKNTLTFPEVLHYFGNLLVCLLKFDSLLESQIPKDQWYLYRKTVRNSSLHDKYNFGKKQLVSLDKILLTFENQLLMGTIFKDVIDKCLENKDLYFKIKKCSLNNEFTVLINNVMSEIEKDESSIDPQLLCKLNIFVVFYCNVFGCTDKKMIKKLLDLNRIISACTLIENIIWYPEQFLLKHVHSIDKYIDQSLIENHRLNLINTKAINFPKETNILCYQACQLFIGLETIAKLNTNKLNTRQLQCAMNVINECLKLVKKINFLLKWVLNIHADKNVSVTKSVILSVCKLIEILKSMYMIYKKNTNKLAYIILLIIQHLSHKALAVLHNVRKQFTQDKYYKEYQLDVLSVFNLCEQVLKGCSTNQRLLVANLALSSSGLPSSTLAELRSVLNDLQTIINFSTTLRDNCNCNFVYWHQNYILPIYFAKLLSSKIDISRYYLMVNALNDYLCSNEENTTISERIIQDELYKPLEQLIEVNLRLQTHLHLQLPPTDPFQNYFSINFNKLSPVMINKRFKSIKIELENHLSTVFYNLTSVVLHDWKTYGEMRKLAYLEYKLNTVEDNLPMQTLEQGLDVLEIMRNINVFVSKYLYNLNTQVFIERSSNNKHLNSISISHVANSIRTHGVGIMNSTVNFTYQFLKNQFYIFSQFLFDEHIKSRLIRDIRFFQEHKTDLNQMYPYERAEKFNVGIRKLGLNETGESYLDLFRKVITQIGNAMGYIRLIRSGGRRCLADGTCFIPDLKKIKNLSNALEKEEVTDIVRTSATKLLDNLQMYLDNIEDATEYFNLLVKVFQPVLKNKSNLHLKNFYVIVSPLTINFIEYSLNCKEKLNKRIDESFFTDDGFALGLAYIIEILDQEIQFNSLHWFYSVQKKIKDDRLRVQEQMVHRDNADAKLNQTLTLTDRKISLYEKEFQLLYYNFNSARLFFQS